MFPKRRYTTVIYSGEFPFSCRWSEDPHSNSPSAIGGWNCDIEIGDCSESSTDGRALLQTLGGPFVSQIAVLFAGSKNLLKCHSATKVSGAILRDQAVFCSDPKIEMLDGINGMANVVLRDLRSQ